MASREAESVTSGEVTTARVWSKPRQLLVRVVRVWGCEEEEMCGRNCCTVTSTVSMSVLGKHIVKL